jgi:V/A-type H+-transporting ATPase subunit D
MAHIKHTKNELKAQREALARYERFLPMLQLKKQQLQMEIQHITAAIAEKQAEEEGVRSGLDRWVSLLAEPVDLENLVALSEVRLDSGNIAGVKIPIFRKAEIASRPYDLFTTPTWTDDAVEVLAALIRLRVERETLEEQKRLIAEELRTTTQRVNLFEKVKIPGGRENIRVIKIFLGDEQTAAVVRGKIAKRRTLTTGG